MAVRRRRHPINLKPYITTLLLAASAGVLLYIPPMNIFIVAGYIVLLSVCVWVISQLFAKNKATHILAPLFVALFLLSNFIAGFNLLNTLLLLSFIIGVRLLFR